MTTPAAIVCVYGMTCGPAVNFASATVGGATLSLPLYRTLDSRYSFQTAEEDQDRGREQRRRSQRQDHQPERLPRCCPVDPGCLFQLPRHVR